MSSDSTDLQNDSECNALLDRAQESQIKQKHKVFLKQTTNENQDLNSSNSSTGELQIDEEFGKYHYSFFAPAIISFHLGTTRLENTFDLVKTIIEKSKNGHRCWNPNSIIQIIKKVKNVNQIFQLVGAPQINNEIIDVGIPILLMKDR